jgi:hypothetical protein
MHGEFRAVFSQGASTMPETLFGVSLRQYPVPQQVVTDTVIPILVVPVYFIHSFEQPFCTEASCTCQRHRQEVVKLFVQIIEGHVELKQTATLIDDNEKENQA